PGCRPGPPCRRRWRGRLRPERGCGAGRRPRPCARRCGRRAARSARHGSACGRRGPNGRRRGSAGRP
ncbi:hypothetical protein KXV85_004948, partial [Aspergillus fumigatus]